jgi:hypothetical protein
VQPDDGHARLVFQRFCHLRGTGRLQAHVGGNHGAKLHEVSARVTFVAQLFKLSGSFCWGFRYHKFDCLDLFKTVTENLREKIDNKITSLT